MKLQDLPLVKRTQQIKDIDSLLAVWFPLALARDHRAVDKVIRLWERQAKLLGIDAPQKIQMSSDGLDGMGEEDLIAEAKRRGIPVYDN